MIPVLYIPWAKIPTKTPDANFSRPHQITVAHLAVYIFYENLTTRDTFTDSESTQEMQVRYM